MLLHYSVCIAVYTTDYPGLYKRFLVIYLPYQKLALRFETTDLTQCYNNTLYSAMC
jgi:hypothetical protein